MNLYLDMFGTLFKRMAPGRAVKANPTCDYPKRTHRGIACRIELGE